MINFLVVLLILAWTQYVSLAIFINKQKDEHNMKIIFSLMTSSLVLLVMVCCYRVRSFEAEGERFCKLIRNHTLDLCSKQSNLELTERFIDLERFVRNYSESVGFLGSSYGWPLLQSVSLFR